jgi:hypothetical protein
LVPKLVFGAVILVAFAGLTPAATAVPKKSTHSANSKSAAAHAKGRKPLHASATRSPAVRSTTAKSARRSKPAGRQSTSRSYVPPQPTAERYQQIQQALAEKGYYKGEPNGQWGADSVDALRRFQNDQNLTSDGKLNSLSLIALGLGPKRITAQAGPAPIKPAATTATPTQPEPGVRQ